MTEMTPVGAAPQPLYRLFQGRSLTGAAQPPAYQADALHLGGPSGGSGTDPALLAQTDQLMRSANPRDKFQAIVNLTKAAPQDAIPRLQALASAPGQDAQVVQLASEALRVMSQMAQQPAVGQPQVGPGTSPTPGQPGQANPGIAPISAQPQQQPFAVYNPGVDVSGMTASDARFMLQHLQSEVAKPEAIKQMAAIAQKFPELKEHVNNVLLNHVYRSVAPSVAEALRALGSFNDPKLVPYLQMVQRAPGHTTETREVAVELLRRFATQGAQNGAQSTGGPPVSVEYIRSMEFELARGGDRAMAAFQQIRNALGADPKAPSPVRQEVIRVLLTRIASSADATMVTASVRLLSEMRAREMNTLQYLDAVARNPGQANSARDAARDAIRLILSTPANP